MAYIIVALVQGHKYYAQFYRGEWLLNGLKNNAYKFQSEELAKEKRLGIKNSFKSDLHITEIKPKSIA